MCIIHNIILYTVIALRYWSAETTAMQWATNVAHIQGGLSCLPDAYNFVGKFFRPLICFAIQFFVLGTTRTRNQNFTKKKKNWQNNKQVMDFCASGKTRRRYILYEKNGKRFRDPVLKCYCKYVCAEVRFVFKVMRPPSVLRARAVTPRSCSQVRAAKLTTTNLPATDNTFFFSFLGGYTTKIVLNISTS